MTDLPSDRGLCESILVKEPGGSFVKGGVLLNLDWRAGPPEVARRSERT